MPIISPSAACWFDSGAVDGCGGSGSSGSCCSGCWKRKKMTEINSKKKFFFVVKNRLSIFFFSFFYCFCCSLKPDDLSPNWNGSCFCWVKLLQAFEFWLCKQHFADVAELSVAVRLLLSTFFHSGFSLKKKKEEKEWVQKNQKEKKFQEIQKSGSCGFTCLK